MAPAELDGEKFDISIQSVQGSFGTIFSCMCGLVFSPAGLSRQGVGMLAGLGFGARKLQKEP